MIKRFETISNYKKSDNLSTSKITKKLRKSEDGKTQIDTEKLLRAIEKEKEIAEEKLTIFTLNQKEVKDRKSKRKHLFYFNELGKEATWLADDIKRFMPASVKKNWKGHHHSQFQYSIAFYHEKRDEAYNILSQFWDFEDEQYAWNKKLKELFRNHKTFENFYQKYLEWRIDFFKKISIQLNGFTTNEKRLKQFIKQQNIWTLFYERLYIIDKTEIQKDKLLAKPLVFPRGIFDDNPTYIKGESIADSPEMYAEWYQYSFKDHPFQRFYDFKRDYKDLFEKEHENPSENKYDLTKEEKVNLFIQKHEKKIKKVKTQDLFLKLVTEDVFKKLFNFKHEFQLSDFYLTQKERIEKELNALEQSKRSKGDSSNNIINDNFVWSFPVPYIKGQVNEPSVRIKDIGKFKYFLEESKVKRILEYDPDIKWTKKELENEISLLNGSYEEIRRERLLKSIQSFEKYILNKYDSTINNHPPEFEDSRNRNPNFKLYIANGVLKKSNLVTKEDICWLISISDKDYEKSETYELLNQKSELTQKAFLLIYIRNKFAHNQLPTKYLYLEIKKILGFLRDEKPTHSEFILLFVDEIIKEFKSLMK